jgi:transcriptional regulator with XRE-family HTH domain
MTPEQIRAARAILKWSARELAEKVGLALTTIQRMENDGGVEGTLTRNINAVQKALEEAGIEFIPENGGGVGVRLKKPRG